MKLSGVMPALVTPFDANNRIDFKAFETHMTGLRSAGVTGWVPCGFGPASISRCRTRSASMSCAS